MDFILGHALGGIMGGFWAGQQMGQITDNQHAIAQYYAHAARNVRPFGDIYKIAKGIPINCEYCGLKPGNDDKCRNCGAPR